MEYSVRLYKDSDYAEVKRWYAQTEEGIPAPDLFPHESTLILEADGSPVFCLIVYLTNSKKLCYFEGWVGNPDFRGEKRDEASHRLVDAACAFAKSLGYQNALTFSYRDKVKERIGDFGFIRTLDNLSAFVKELI